jgi:N4-(beta-N-acetylglucosaminyl)-L-asparaginase
MNVTRRFFVSALGAGAALAATRRGLAQGAAKGAGGPIAIASANGLRATAKAVELLRGSADPLDACVEGVRIIEDDPADNSVGFGGLPNEDGVVELDASVMHGPTHRAGAVAGLQRIRNPAAVAREVARRTDHVLLVGEGALRFALRMGFVEQELLTEESRQAWLKWRESLTREDDWLAEDEWDLPGGRAPGKPRSDGAKWEGRGREAARGVEFTTGTVHCSALAANGDVAGCTSTSGLSWKLPGRVGDSPIIGAGLYCDNAVGSAGATGRGEAVLQVCGARAIVSRMDAGDSPTEACLAVLKMIADRTRAKRLLDASGRPSFGVTFYALRKDGAYGSASMWSGVKFSVCDARGERREECASLFQRA